MKDEEQLKYIDGILKMKETKEDIVNYQFL